MTSIRQLQAKDYLGESCCGMMMAIVMFVNCKVTNDIFCIYVDWGYRCRKCKILRQTF